MTKPESIDQYISTFAGPVQEALGLVRATIQKYAPEATEKISYAMPTFYYLGNLIHFAGYDKHIGLYALPSGNEAFKKELSAYKTGKGSIQFPLDKPMPVDLIRQITEFRVKENEEKAMLKQKK
jgi:uncharacterized protein YdhG (YjbR/CyaY superfamily)